MTQGDFQKALATAEKELAEELGKLKATQERITRLENAINALRELSKQQTVSTALEALRKMKLEPSAVQALGLTEIVKGILRQAHPKDLTAPEIRDELVALGFDLSGYKNPLAAIHNLIGRLVASNEISVITTEGREAVRWKPFHRRPSYGASGSLANTILAKKKD